MSNIVNAEVVVIGAGPAGYVCAIRLAQLGKKVTVIDRDEVGGVCLNRGCIPSKALIYASGLADRVRHAEAMGVTVKGLSIDLEKMIQWKNGVVKKLTTGVAGLLKANGCTFIAGDAKFTSPRSLEVKLKTGGTQTVNFQQLVIANGSRPTAIPSLPVDQKDILDSTGALNLTEIPESVLCVGGGYIGLELGMYFSKLGTKVIVAEGGERLLSIVDPQLTQVLSKSLDKRGVEVLTKAMVKGAKKTKSGMEVTISVDGKDRTVVVDKVLVTVGRTPNANELALEKAGLKADSKGFVTVDLQRRTSQAHIYAIGDVAGQPMLAHKGSKEGMIAAEAIAGHKVAYDVVGMPAVIFTDPEIATVGLSEAEAKAKGIDVMIGTFPFAANGRALSVAEPDGMVKVVGDKKTGRLLGVHIIGAEASNLIAEATLALEMGAMVEDLALTVHAHPTLPETMMEAAEAALGHAIHIFQAKRPGTSPQAHA